MKTHWKITAVQDNETQTRTAYDVCEVALTAAKLQAAGAVVTVTQHPDPIQAGLDLCLAKLNARAATLPN